MKVHTKTARKVLHFWPVDIHALQLSYCIWASGHKCTTSTLLHVWPVDIYVHLN